MSARNFLIESLTPFYNPRETRPIAEWAKETITIERSENKAMAGLPYDVSLTPYNRTIFDFIQETETRELIILKSSQIGLTYSVYIAMAWLSKYQPGNMMYCARDEGTVRELGKQRITPILKQIDATISDDLDARDQTVMVKRVNGATLRLIGAQSASGFITWPASYGFGDEYETHPLLPEGSTGDLMRARFKADPDHKLILFSKAQDQPIYETDKTTKKAKLISGQGTRCCDEYYSGTQEKWHVPCPHCGHFQELIWGRMKLKPEAIVSEPGALPVVYDYTKVLTATHYECEACNAVIEDRDKRKIVPLGKPVPTPADKREGPYPIAFPGRRSFHVSDLLVFLFPSVSWGHLMVKWLEAQGDDEKLDAFFNDHLGLPRPERKSAGRVELAAIERLISDYNRLRCYDSGRRWINCVHELPVNPLFVGIAVDKQDGYLKFVIQAFMQNGEIYVLDWGSLAEEEDITHLLENWRGKSPDGRDFFIFAGVMDCGFRRSKVIEYALEIRGLIPFFSPARGHQRVNSRASVWVTQDTSIPGKSCDIVNFDSQAWETDLYRRRIIDFDPRKPKRRYPRLHFPVDVDVEFKEELSNAHQVEEIVKEKRTGAWIWTKLKDHAPNDYADCMKMALILWVLHAPENEEEEGSTETKEQESPD